MILSEKGKKLMDSITEVSLRLEQNEQRALESAIRDKENSFKFIEIFGICGIVFSIIVAIGFLIILKQTTRLQKSLKESDKFFNISLDLLCIVDSKYFKKVNPAFTALLGYDEKVLLSKPFLTFVNPDDLQPSTTESKKIEEMVAVHHFINRFRKKDGLYLWIDWVTAPDPKKQLAYVVGRDITEMKHVEEELIHSREKAEQLLINLETSQIKVVANEKMAAFGVMASRVGHEILNPLNFVNNFSEISEELAKEIISSESDKVRNEAAQMLLLNVQKIKEHGKHAAEIIQKLQERTRAGKAYEFFERDKSNEV